MLLPFKVSVLLKVEVPLLLMRSQGRGAGGGVDGDRTADRVRTVGHQPGGIAGGVGVADRERTGGVAEDAGAAAGDVAAGDQRAGGDGGRARIGVRSAQRSRCPWRRVNPLLPPAIKPAKVTLLVGAEESWAMPPMSGPGQGGRAA